MRGAWNPSQALEDMFAGPVPVIRGVSDLNISTQIQVMSTKLAVRVIVSSSPLHLAVAVALIPRLRMLLLLYCTRSH